jgi:hypothetical protein
LPQENPAPRIGTKTPYRKSQVTKKKPTGRLVARRKVNTVKGRFPNPAEVVKAHGNRHQISYSRNDKDVWLEYRKPGDKKWNRYMAFYNTPAGKKAAVSECKKQALSDKKFEWHVVTP